MDLYDILNITNKDIETQIIDTIKEVRREYEGLVTERTCIVYNSLVFEILRRKHIVAKLIDTTDYNIEFRHQFVLVPIDKENSYLIDLTYRQFGKDDVLCNLYQNGYEKIQENELKYFLKRVTKEERLPSIRNLI